MVPMVEAFKQSKKICFTANNLALYMRKATGIQSHLIYYEEIFFLYFLNDIVLNQNDYPVSITIRIKEALLKVLSHTDNDDYKKYAEVMDIIISFRSKIYSDLFFKYNENFTPDFFLECFMYQSELLIYIQENNNFMDAKQKPCSLPEWIHKTAQDDTYKKIVNVLKDNIDMLLDFITYKAPVD